MAVKFATAFSKAPSVQCNLETGTPNRRIASATDVTQTGFTLNVYDELINTVAYVEWTAICI